MTETLALAPLEAAVLESLLAGALPALAVLRAQLAVAVVTERELTGVGFFVHFSVLGSSPRLATSTLVFGDVNADLPGLVHGAGFLLFIEDGRLSTLEGHLWGDDAWPERVDGFRVRSVDPTRGAVLDTLGHVRVRWLYSAWFQDPRLPSDDQGFEWPACFVIEASSAAAAKAWGDQLSKRYGERMTEPFLRSDVELMVAADPALDALPVVIDGDDASDEQIGW